MNFLQICQRARSEFGISGSGPVTVISQTGEMQRVVNWVNAAWMDIQAAHQNWHWLRTSATFATVAGQALYSPTTDIGLTDFGMWEQDTFRVYNTATGLSSESFLPFVDYVQWRDTYQSGSARTTTSQPQVMTIAPNKSIGLGPVPAAGYTISGDYFKAPSEMALDADIPVLPTQFHMAIVYRAMMFYGAYEAAGEKYQEGDVEFKKLMRRMRLDGLPGNKEAGAMA